MKKLSSIFVLCLITINLFAQFEEIIGMSAERFLLLSKANRQYVDVNYYNGEIIDMVTCQDNMIVIELKKRFNICKIYMVSNGVIQSVATRFEDASIEEIEELYSIRYNKIDDYYFDEGNKYYVKVFLPFDGYPTAELHKTNYEKLPREIKSKIAQQYMEQEKAETDRKEMEAERKEMERDLFLQKRESTFYNLSELDIGSYNQVLREIENIIIAKISMNERLVLKIQIDASRRYDENTIWEIKFLDNVNVELQQRIIQAIKTIELPLTINGQYNLSLNTDASFNFDCTVIVDDCSVSNLDQGYIIDGNPISGQEILNDIKNNKYSLGEYKATLNSLKINSIKKSSIVYKTYTGLGGPSNALLSVLMPGLGRHFVNDTKKYPWLVTLGSLGSIGTGIYFKTESNKSYDLYRTANYSTPQERINDYYEQANSQNKQAYGLMAFGVAIWLYDVIWTTQKGIKNNKRNIKMDEKLSFTPLLLDKSNFGFGLTYNF